MEKNSQSANDFVIKLAFYMIDKHGLDFTLKTFSEASTLNPIGQLSPRSLVQLSTETATIAGKYDGIDDGRDQ